MNFYFEISGNNNYSQKIYHTVFNGIEILSRHPFIGKVNKKDNTRKFILSNFEINYEFRNNKIIISMIWDSLMNPENRRFGE
jgi:hypothetical protein